MRAAASTTAAAYFFPGWRVVRSMGPLTLTAAITLPSWARTGALTEATPGLALGDALGPPPPERIGIAAQDAARRAGVERQCRTERHDRAQAVGRLERFDAHAAIAVAHVQLRALARRVAERLERGPSDLGEPQPVRGGATECDQAEPEREAPVCVAADEAMRLERRGEAVGRRSRQSRDCHELGERAGLLLECAEHGHRLVEHPDAAYAAVHKPRF